MLVVYSFKSVDFIELGEKFRVSAFILIIFLIHINAILLILAVFPVTPVRIWDKTLVECAAI